MSNQPPTHEPTAFQRFQELTAKLLAVPKREVDAKEKSKRKRRKAHKQQKTASK
jgi:hypothetical protein